MGRSFSVLKAPLAALGLLGALATSAGAPSPEAQACPVVAPEPVLLSPARDADAPLNAKVRLELPTWGGYSGPPDALRLRATAPGVEPREVAVKAQTVGAPRDRQSLVELTPLAPLAPSTRYEVALLRGESGSGEGEPRVLVFGTFRTGTAADTAAPRIEKVGPIEVRWGQWPNCTPDTPQVTLRGVAARDPGRPKAPLLFGVWLSDASGRIDASRPPDDIQRSDLEPPPPPPPPPDPNAPPPPHSDAPAPSADGVILTVGQRSACDASGGLAIPGGPASSIGIAAIDEAGNASALRRVPIGAARPAP